MTLRPLIHINASQDAPSDHRRGTSARNIGEETQGR